MELQDTQLEKHLTELGITHNQPPYLHLYNNNHAITDNKNFFAKTLTDPRSPQIELETSQHFTYAPKPLHPSITQIGEHYLHTTEYIPHTNLTLKNITQTDIKNIISQLQKIHQLPHNIYSQPRKLEETLNLTNNRLNNPNLTPTQHEQLTILINTYIKPYIAKYENSPTLAHTDLKLDNILKTLTGKIIIIDYEGIKASPIEADLAALYQSLYQAGHQNLYHKFYKEYLNAYPTLNHKNLKESILFKNTLTTTAAIKLAPQILDQRIKLMMETLTTHTPTAYLPAIFDKTP